MNRRAFLAALGLTPLLARAASAPAVFVVHPYDIPSRLYARFRPLTRYLGDVIGRPLRLRIAHSYDEQIETIATGRADYAYLGPTPYVRVLAACRTLVVDSEKRPRRGQFLPDLPPHSPAMGQKAGEKWTAAVDLQPTIPKSDRLLAWAEIQCTDGQVLGSTGRRLAEQEPLRVPLRAADGVIGQVLAQYDPRPASRAAWNLAGAMALGLALFAAMTFWALRRVLLNRLVAPVAALIEQADPERASIPVSAGLPAEVAELAAAIGGLRGRIDQHLRDAEEAAQSRNEALRRLCSEQRLASIGQIAGEVAHELNTPLSDILGYAQSALPLTGEGELRESLQTIEAQARRAGQIVRDMLTAARAPAPSLQVVDLAALAAAFTRLVTPLARKQGCAIVLETREPLMVRTDATRVEQILFNLVFNAVQAGAREVRLAIADGLTMSDDGPGLPETVRARLFEPFITTKPAGQGTGLGLAISQRLAREMGRS